VSETANSKAERGPFWTRAVNGVAVGFSALTVLSGLLSVLGLDHSDAEIQASLVDTWQASALGSYALLGITFFIALVSFALARGATGTHRGKLLFTAWVAVTAFAFEFVGMLVLTHRAEVLSGHNLSGLFYFF
jgi:hypothetical protein